MIGDWIGSFFAALDAMPAWQLYAGLAVLLVLETTVLIGLVTPGEVVLLAAATTVSDAGEYLALAAVAAGASVVGQTGGYLLGRGFGGRIRAGWVGRRVGEGNWVRAEALLQGGAGRAVVVSRFFAVVHSLVPVLAGSLGMPMRRYLVLGAVSATAWGLGYVALGSAASQLIREAAGLIGPTLTAGLVAAVLVALVARAVRRHRARPAVRGPVARDACTSSERV